MVIKYNLSEDGRSFPLSIVCVIQTEAFGLHKKKGERMKRERTIRVFIFILSCLLIVNVVLLAKIGVYSLFDNRPSETVIIDDNIITPDEETSESEETRTDTEEQDEQYAATISLHRGKLEDTEPFEMENMFPGDFMEKTYAVDVKYQGTVTVHFHTVVRDEYEALAEGLSCHVQLSNSGEVLYDGPMLDMPESLSCTLRSDTVVTDQLRYIITAYLDTSAGNECQNQKLMVDFQWWVDDAGKENLKPVLTGDRMMLVAWLTVSLISVCVLLFLLLKKLREEEKQHGE